MICNFSERKDLNERVEKGLQALRKEYERPEMSEEQLDGLLERMEEAKRMNKKDRNKKNMIKIGAAAAVLMGAFVLLPNTSAGIAHAMEQIPVIGQFVEVVTFRDYTYETDRNTADIEVPEIKVADVVGTESGAPEAAGSESSTPESVGSESTEPETEAGQSSEVQEKLARTTEEINAEIKEITDKLIEEFEGNLGLEWGYQDVVVKSEVLTSTQDYFTLKLICYQGAGSGYAWNYYYTIDLNTGERLQMKDLFVEGADYITPISENIKEQMQEQMDADEMVYYWLHDEIEEWNFKAITDETSFYVNDKGNVVIGFNEGDVAPMYMGTVEFEIPGEVLEDIRR